MTRTVKTILVIPSSPSLDLIRSHCADPVTAGTTSYCFMFVKNAPLSTLHRVLAMVGTQNRVMRAKLFLFFCHPCAHAPFIFCIESQRITVTILHITMGAFPLVQDLWWVARNNGVMETEYTFKFGSSSAPDKSGERVCNFCTALILKTPHISLELKHSKR